MTDNLVGLGLHAEVAEELGEWTLQNTPSQAVGSSLTATGTTIADALQLTRLQNFIGTTALNTGVKLPSQWPIGAFGIVFNGGANPVNLFPPSASININGGSAGAAVTIAAAAGNLIVRQTATSFRAFVLALEA